MRKAKYHPQPLFENLDPPEIGYEQVLLKNGAQVADIHAEYAVSKVLVQDDVLLVQLRKVWTDGRGQPLGGQLELYFYGCKIMPSPINEAYEQFQKITDITSMRSFEPSSEEITAGYSKGLELDTDQGLWDLIFAKARVVFEPEL